MHASDTLKIKPIEAPGTTSISSLPKVKNIAQILGSIQYPQSLRQQGIEGKVVANLWIDEKGKITNYQIAHSTDETLSSLVNENILLLEFEPAKNEFGVAVSSKTKLPFHFNLKVD